MAPFCQGKKKLCRKRQRLLVTSRGQTPSKMSESAEDPKRSNILGASSLKIILRRRFEVNSTERDKK